MPKYGNKNDIRVLGMHLYFGDVPGIFQTDVLPCFPPIIGSENACTRECKIPGLFQILTGSQVYNIRIGRSEGEITD
jgi:hypothetical protein